MVDVDESLKRQSGRQEVKPDAFPDRLDAQLIVEEFGGQARLVSELGHWLNPEKTSLSLTQAARPISDTNWFFHEPRVYLETVVERQQILRDQSEQWIQELRGQGFSLKEGGLGVTSDEGCQRLLDDLRQEPRDLLVVVSPWPPSGFSLCLARHATCSVLLLRTPLKSRIGRLVALLATDGTEAAATAARKLPDFIRREHLSATVVTVQQPYYAENAVFAPFVNIPAMEVALGENATLILDIARALLEEKGVQVLDCVRLSGMPAQELLRMAEEKVVPDLMVVGAHNRSALSNWLLGSVSQRLLHDAPYNLLIVR